MSVPTSTFRPTSAKELACFLADDNSEKVRVVGGRSWLDSTEWPNSTEPRSRTEIDMTAMNSVVEYAADDMTVTVQSGMLLSDLSAVLADRNQELPFDCVPKTASIGGRLSIAHAGPLCWSAGLWRDRVLGVEAVDGTGRIFHSGGRVVKNVAGYDLSKLLIGAHGTLGAVTEVTLKVRPRPNCAHCTGRLSDLKLVASVVRDIVGGKVTVSSLSIREANSEWFIVIAAEGVSARSTLEPLAQRLGFEHVADGRTPDDKQSEPFGLRDGSVSIRVPLSQWVETTTETAALVRSAGLPSPVVTWLGGPICFAAGNQLSETLCKRLNELVHARAGRWSTSIPSSLQTPTAHERKRRKLMSGLRTVFDPQRRFDTFGLQWLEEARDNADGP